MRETWNRWHVPTFFRVWDRGNPGGFMVSENAPIDPIPSREAPDATREVTIERRWDGKWTVGAGVRPSGALQWEPAGDYGPFSSESGAKLFAENYRDEPAFFMSGQGGSPRAKAIRSFLLSETQVDRQRREADRIEREAALVRE